MGRIYNSIYLDLHMVSLFYIEYELERDMDSCQHTDSGYDFARIFRDSERTRQKDEG